MEAEQVLPIVGKVAHSVYLPHSPEVDAGMLALGIASIFTCPVRVFRFDSDLVTVEQGRELADALCSPSAVILYGSSESKLIQTVAHHWPDHVDHQTKSGGSIFRNVDVKPAKDGALLAAVYLLVPSPTKVRGYTRAAVVPISPGDVEELLARGAQSKLRAEPLGYVYTGATVDVSMKDLYLLHERDPEGVSTEYKSWHELLASASALTWRDLRAALQGRAEHSDLDNLRSRLTHEQFVFGHSAIDFLWRSRVEMEGQIYPDIYSAVWNMEYAFQPGTVFRGQYQSKWGLDCTLLRHPKGGELLDVAELIRRVRSTESFLDAARQRENELFGGPVDESSLLAVAQHFGFPTPLLDFTESFKVAALFATLEAQRHGADDPAIGVIFYMTSPLEEQLSLADGGDGRGLHDLAGVRVGKLHAIRPNLPAADDRIRRQHGVFIAGYRARDLQAVSIDRVYFRQIAGVTFEDRRAGISADTLLPENTPLSNLAAEMKGRSAATPALASSLLAQTALSESSVIGSAGAHLYWHLRFGQYFLANMRQEARRVGADELCRAIEDAVNEYFTLAHVEASISEIPDHKKRGTMLEPIRTAIAGLESAAGLAANEMWQILAKHLPRGFESGGMVEVDVPKDWSDRAHVAFSCAMFCVAWEHLRNVSGLRAEELVQTAQMHLFRQASELARTI